MKLWIARDNNTRYEQLFTYYSKPIKQECDYVGDICFSIPPHLFPEVTFENSPQEVELVIKKKDERK